MDVYINTFREYEKMNFDTCVSGHNKVLNKVVINKILNDVIRVGFLSS